MAELRWSHKEKEIARRAYDAALDKALTETIATFKAKAATVATPSEMWDIEDYLRKRRRHMEALFDYRYSQLCFVFAQLIHLGHLNQEQLAGLSDEKLEDIRSIGRSFSRRD